MSTAIEFNNVSKLYRLGVVSSGTLSNDLKRGWQVSVRGKEDPNKYIDEDTAIDYMNTWLKNLYLLC